MVELYLLNTVLEKLQAAVDKGETGIFFMFSGAEIWLHPQWNLGSFLPNFEKSQSFFWKNGILI